MWGRWAEEPGRLELAATLRLRNQRFIGGRGCIWRQTKVYRPGGRQLTASVNPAWTIDFVAATLSLPQREREHTHEHTTAVSNLLRQMMIFGFLTFWSEQYYSFKYAYKTSIVDTMTILFCLIYVGPLVDNNAWKDGQNIKLWIQYNKDLWVTYQKLRSITKTVDEQSCIERCE